MSRCVNKGEYHHLFFKYVICWIKITFRQTVSSLCLLDAACEISGGHVQFKQIFELLTQNISAILFCHEVYFWNIAMWFEESKFELRQSTGMTLAKPH
jgi:hypothetical protein